MEKKVWFFHLLNDFSGSPNVLSQIVKIYSEKGYRLKITTTADKGFLSELEGVSYTYYKYRWSPQKLLTLWRLFYVQWKLFWRVLWSKNLKGSTVFINTLLPFGPALAGKLKGAKVVYHIHESYIKPRVFRSFLVGVAKLTAHKVVMVSQYLFDQYPALQQKSLIINNALTKDFVASIKETNKDESPFTVLMLASLKEYKGVNEFVEISKLLPEINFELVLNTTQEEMDENLKGLPQNVQVFPAQSDVHPFYQRASLVLNLTIPELCEESFGMTILEGKAYGIPSIVPPAGGPKELVENGVDGYHIHPQNINMQAYVIYEIAKDELLQRKLKNNAAISFEKYAHEVFKEKVLGLVS